ncbi:MAG: hypothetical protein U0228_11600 [Myxococcaceae bacterium]
MSRTASGWALLALGLISSASYAQGADGGAAAIDATKVANPGDGNAQVIRDLPDLGDDGGVAATPLQVDLPGQGAADAGTATANGEKKGESNWNLSASLSASARINYGGSTLFPLDADRTTIPIAPLQTRIRVTPEIHLSGFGLIAEADAATGAIIGTPPDTLVGERQPVPRIRAVELRKLYLEYKWASGAFRVGQQTSQWGLGLLANDGNSDPQAGDFGQQHFGNLTYRALLAARPLFGMGGGYRAFEVALAADLIVRDNFGEFSRGDRAFQGVLALRFNKDAENNFGVYAVYRNQRNINSVDGGKATDAFVVDVAGRWHFIKTRHRDFKVGFEVVGIGGTTTQARNENAPLLKVAEFGGAIKSTYRMGNVFIYLDGGFASGDQNPSDDRVENFRFDRDYKVGLILFDQVMAYQSGRSSIRAADPALTGTAPEGADLLGTAGSITGAWYLFPRVRIAMADWLDGYGGPLFAFSTAKLTDPFNSRINGGTSLNPLGAPPGMYLGTELDLGAQARFKPIKELTISLTAEGGLFLPGTAYNLPTGGVMAPVAFGRLRLGASI